MEIQLKPPSGTPTTPLMSSDNIQLVADGQGRYAELAKQGRLFILDSDAVTMSATLHLTKGAFGTQKFINGFYNGSTNKYVCIQRVIVGVTSGTMVGQFYWNHLNLGAVTITNTGGTIRSAVLGLATSSMTPMVNVVMACTPANTTALVQTALLASPANTATPQGVNDDPSGALWVPPGYCAGIMGGAGTPVVQSTIWFSEHTLASMTA